MRTFAIVAIPIAVVTAWLVVVRAEEGSKLRQIQGHGAVMSFPNAPAQPRDDAKILVDLTVGGLRDQINPGMEKLARYVNIYAAAGKQPAHANLVVVLHGDATQLALDRKAYATAFETDKNPNLPLMRQLSEAGVTFLVCGQSLNSKGFKPGQAMDGVVVVVSALTALVNYQQDGYAYVPLLK